MRESAREKINRVLRAAPDGLTCVQAWDALTARGDDIDLPNLRHQLSNGVVRGLYLSTNTRPAVYRINPRGHRGPPSERDLPLRVRLEHLQADISDIRYQAAEQRVPMDVSLGLDSLQRSAGRLLRDLGG